MANNSPTLVMASLSDDQLKKSIDSLVTHVDEAMKKMVKSTNNAVGEMEAKLKSLGSLKIDSGGTADGGSSRRTKMLLEESLKAKEVAMTYDQMQAAFQRIAKDNSGLKDIRTFNKEELQSYIDLLRKLQAEYVRVNTQEGGGAKSDQIKRDMAELEKIIQGYQTILRNVEAINSRQGTIDVKKWTQDIGAVDDRYKKLVRWYTVLEKEDQRRIANEEKANQKRLAELNKEEAARQKMIESARKAEEKYQNAVLKTAFNKIVDMPSNNIDQMRSKLERLQTILANIREMGILSPKEIANAETEIGKLRGNIQQIEKIERERIEAEKRFVVEQSKEIEQTQTLEGRIKSLAQIARERLKESQQSFTDLQAYGRAFRVFDANSPFAKGLSIEEQIKNALTEEKAARESVSQSAQQQANATQNVTKAQKEESETIHKNFRDYDSIRQAIASVLGVRAENVRLQGVEVTSVNDLSNRLKELRSVYNQLGTQDRHSERGKELISQIQNIERQMDRARKELSRPIDLKSALGTSEKTLDDIAYKMQRLSSYRSGLNVDTQKKEINTVNQEYDRLKKKMDEVMQKNQSMIASNNALGRSWNYMKNRLAFYFTVGASTQFIKNLIEVRSQYEMNERALGILINSAERGTQIFNELSQMALVSPYTLIELSAAAKQLTAYDIAAKDVVDTTRRLADMASAVGVPIERLTYALGQIKAYGYLNSRDARMFANAGIPLVRELSKYYSELEGRIVSVGDVYDRMKKKAIDYNSVMAVVTKMTDEGGKFFDFQAKMADTLKVQLANLTLAWNNMLNDLGSSQQGVLVGGIAALKNLFLHWQDIYDVIQKVVYAFGLYKLAQATSLIWTGRITTAMGMQELVGKKLQARLAGLAAANKSFVAASTMGWMALASVIVEVLYTWNRNVEEIERLNKTIADGAKESAKSLGEFLESTEISQARLSAQTKKLPKADAEKTWESLREQIELSSMSSDKIIPKLLEIGNLNERLTTAFDLAERIKDANEKLSGLEDSLDISQDTILGGLLGEGLIEDIEDYNEHLAYSAEKAEYFTKSNHGFWENAAMGLKALYNEVRESMGSSTDEAEAEIRNFAKNAAQTIKDELGEEGIKDNIKVNEAIARVISGVEQMFPQLRGKGKLLFETMFNDIMAKEFEGAVDKQAYYYKLFLERLKKDHASAFQDVTEDINRETFVWSDAQLKAIEKTANNVKTDLPEAAQKAIDDIVNNLNRQEFKMRIVAEFATSSLDDINKAFRKRFIEAGTDAANAQIDATQKGLDKIKDLSPWGGGNAGGKSVSQKETENLQKFGSLMRKQNESDLDYQERIRKERQKKLDIQATEAKIIAANTGREEEGAKAVLASAREQKKAADDWLDAASQVEKWGGYDFSTKKENTAATKAQHAAETELQKALRDELQLIDRVRSQYKKLVDAGANSGEALAYVTNQFGNSLARINSILGKNGIPLFDISKFAGTDNPQALLDMLKLQLDSAKVAKNIKPEEIKELEVKYSEIVVDAKAYNLSKITKGLNNELDRLKDEYELAVSLDEDPELGNMFADWMGIDVNDLPRTASEYAERASKILNSKLKDLGAKTEPLDVLKITDDDMRAFEDNKTFTKEQLELVKKAVEAARGFQRKETEERIKDWDKLLEKYAEYETKINRIQNDAVKERVTFAQQFGRNEDEKSLALNLQTQILSAKDPQEKQKLIQQLQELVKSIAGNDKTKINLVTSINNSEQQGLAKESFEQFQKTPTWLVATGDLAGMTNKAINGLIASLEKYKKSAKNLDPKQIKNINNALKNLYKEQRKENPFGAIANMIDEAKERLATVQPEMDSIMSDIIAIEKEIGDGEATEEQIKTLDELKEQWKKLSEVGKISAGEWVAALTSVYGVIKGAIELVDELAMAIGGKKGSDIQRVFGVLDKAVQGAQIGAAFGKYGAAIGAAAGAATGFIKEFGDEFSGNSSINTNVKQSEINVRRLQTAFKDLEYEIEKVGGTGELTLKKVAIASREWQLAELKRQLTLEESRTSKNRDDERIEDLRSQIKDLELDLKRAADEIVNDFLGISSVGDAAENMMGAFISALRSGEDAMASFNGSIDDMIANMLKKLLTTKILEPRMKEIWDNIQSDIDRRTKLQTEELQSIEEFSKRGMSDLLLKRVSEVTFGFTNKSWLDGTTEEYKELWEKMYSEYQASTGKLALDDMGRFTEDFTQWFFSSSSDYLGDYKKRLEHELANAWQEGDIRNYAEQLRSLSPEMQDSIDYVNQLIKELGLEESSQQSLSSLQQGISQISEQTANSIEAYLNGVSQQVYLHSELLTQIRDAIMGTDSDIQLGVQGQMLLQLQNNYIIMQSIQSIMEGWSTPSGMGVRVELIS